MAIDLHNEIKRAERECNRLKQRDLTESDKYIYWAERLQMLHKLRWNHFIAALNGEHGTVTLERRLISNGAHQVSAFTESGRFIQHIKLNIIPDEVFNNLPIINDFRTNNPPCTRCGTLGTELHHWAPQHLFEDANEWPTDYLCKRCHDKWHLTIQNHKKYNGVRE